MKERIYHKQNRFSKLYLSIFFLGIILLSIQISSADYSSITRSLYMNSQITDEKGRIQTGTFDMLFKISTDSDCTNVVYIDSSNQTTDNGGFISMYLSNINVTFNGDYYLCYYRDGILKEVTFLAPVPIAYQSLQWNGLDGPLNITELGKINFTLGDKSKGQIGYDYNHLQFGVNNLASFEIYSGDGSVDFEKNVWNNNNVVYFARESYPTGRYFITSPTIDWGDYKDSNLQIGFEGTSGIDKGIRQYASFESNYMDETETWWATENTLANPSFSYRPLQFNVNRNGTNIWMRLLTNSTDMQDLGGNTKFWFDVSKGRLGIGTGQNTPSASLQVNGTTMSNILQLPLTIIGPCGNINGTIARNATGLYYCGSTGKQTLLATE